jgi:hypothetical protein
MPACLLGFVRHFSIYAAACPGPLPRTSYCVQSYTNELVMSMSSAGVCAPVSGVNCVVSCDTSANDLISIEGY